MGSYGTNSKGLREVMVMEKVAETAAPGKKRKVGLESDLSTPSVQLKTWRLAAVSPVNSASRVNSGYSTCERVGSDNVLASCCSSNGSSELEKEEENEVTLEFFATSTGDSLDCTESHFHAMNASTNFPSQGRVVTTSYFFRRETIPSSEVQAESGELESTARPHESDSLHRFTAEKMPSEDELEEFFAAAEKNLQKQFIDKYNYDIVKDEPLEGRYEWVQIQLKP